jgi:hypothetical protein
MKDLLAEHMVRPTRMELWVADADGKNAHQVTELESGVLVRAIFLSQLASQEPPTVASSFHRTMAIRAAVSSTCGR